MREKLLPPILVYLRTLMTTSAPEGANLAGYVKSSREDRVFCRWPRSRFFFRGSGRLSSDFHGGVLQPCFFMWYRLTRYHGIPLHILGFQSRDIQWRRIKEMYELNEKKLREDYTARLTRSGGSLISRLKHFIHTLIKFKSINMLLHKLVIKLYKQVMHIYYYTYLYV